QELAETLSDVLEKPVVYNSLSMDEMRERMKNQGMKVEMIDSYLALAAYQKAGSATARVSESVEEILGRKPRTIRDFVTDYKEHFR
ncbi:MAG TPA: hypothetical protein VK040_08230, partial [Balneolaceae bacterium]|nr:hypothetical protein [Balneolaceae bacterium]